MCGIVAAISWKKPFKNSTQSNFDSALNLLSHRGPDFGQSKMLCSVNTNSDYSKLYFGHRRLSILDLSQASNQPMELDGYWIIFNGEIFNYIEIRRELEKFYEFQTDGDTEVILRAYQKWGSSYFGKFNGFWSFIIYDPKLNNVIISRDRFSIKPLHYFEEDGRIYFASEIKALKVLSKSLNPNQKTIELFLNQGLLETNTDSFYKEIKRFPAMHNWTIDLNTGEKEVEQYWHYSAPDYADSFEERQQQFKALFIDALKLRLRSDVPVGAMLSGGLDSSAIVTIIQAYLNKDVQSFSVVSDEKKYSEESFIDILISENKINNQKLRFNSDLALDNIETVVAHQDEPFGSLSVVAQYLLFKKIKDETNIKVLYSGQGADEVLLGYKKFFFMHLQELFRKRKYYNLLNTAGSSFIKGTTIREFSWNEAKRYLPGKTGKGRGYFKKEFDEVSIWSINNMSDRQIQDIDRYSVPILAHFEDRNSMANGLEVRLPFLDYRLVNFLVHAPIEDKLKGGWTKYILRKSIHEMPKAIRWRKDKTGFIIPEEKWLKGRLGSKIIQNFESPSLLDEMGILDPSKFKSSLKGYQNSSKWLSSKDFVSVYITELWLRQNF